MNHTFFVGKLVDEDDELETARLEATEVVEDEIDGRSIIGSETDSHDSGEDIPSVDSDYGDESCLKRKFGSSTS